MENKFKFFVGAILAICVISYVYSLDDHKEVNTHDLPENTSYFNLMGISIEEIDKIEVSYQSINSSTGYKENGVYYALINETERPLNSKSEYIFFMKKHPLEEKFEKKQGVEYVYLSDRQCGVCEIIDNRVWPIFNALPETSWYIGQTLEEIEASWK